MDKLIKYVVYNDKVYCWDKIEQRPIEAELRPKETIEMIPDEALKLLFAKLLEDEKE